MGVATINKQFQITIPKEIIEQLQLHAGDKVEIQSGTERYLIIKLLESVVDASFGLWQGEEESLRYVNEIRDEAENRLTELEIE
ncbi:AbrB/MazE/SpoVT family DNA-binding domain-containing protein [bacterium]|nr:AbrB/MazE/SpoVT family DNA-binding domain-containing protein [bacterium]